jgi:AI-2 transport protein TqsA
VTQGARGGSPLTAGVMVMAIIMTGATLWALRSLLEPLALAIFLLLIIDAMARTLTERAPWLASWAALPAAILAIVALFGLAIWAITDNARHFVGQAGEYADKLDALLSRASNQFGIGIPSSVHELWTDIDPRRYAGAAAEALKGIGETAVFVLIYLGFLIASRAGFAAKMSQMFSNEGSTGEAERIAVRVRHGVESYIWVQTLVGLIIASASAAIMMVMGLSHALFWAFIIFLASYIPVIGAAIGVLIPPLFGLVEFADPWRSLALLIALEVVHFIVSHVLQPRMQGCSLNLDPVVVLFSLAFWGLLWGVAGAILSTPLTVLLTAILAEFPSTRWLAVLLSSDGRPDHGVRGAPEGE